MLNYRSFSLTILNGRLGQDCKLITAKSGAKMLAFSVGTSVSVKDAAGKYSQKTSWHDCLMGGQRAEKMAALLKKGTLVSVQGQISYKEVELKSGYKGKTASIFVEDLQILAQPQTQSAPASQAAGAPAQAAPFDEVPAEEIPF